MKIGKAIVINKNFNRQKNEEEMNGFVLLADDMAFVIFIITGSIKDFLY